jgi:hypothetical protein
MSPHLTEHPEHSVEEVDRLVGEFFAWADGALPYRVAYKREQGVWFALAPDYDITARGDTLNEAFEELLELVIAYLYAYFQDEQPVSTALRRVPLRMRVAMRALALLNRLLHGMARKPPTAGNGNIAAPSVAVKQALAC